MQNIYNDVTVQININMVFQNSILLKHNGYAEQYHAWFLHKGLWYIVHDIYSF